MVVFYKKILVLIIALFLIQLCAAEEPYWGYDSLNLDIDYNTDVNITYPEEGGMLDSLMLEWPYLPLNDYRQEASKIGLLLEEDELENLKAYKEFKNVGKKAFYSFDISVKTTSSTQKVNSKVGFPLKNLAEPYLVYTKPAGNVNSDSPEIRSFAENLVKGDDDLYSVVFKLAKWVSENIESDMSYEGQYKDASWVLENRKGVCAEHATLFAALARSLGIPVRIVSGVIYDKEWENHAWNEVYFPSYGWVPFDTTNKEFGWVDATHVKMENRIYNRPFKIFSISYIRYSGETPIINADGDIQPNIESYGNELKPDVMLKAELMDNGIGTESYVPLRVTIRNLEDYYVTPVVNLNIPSELLMDDDEKIIFLKPNEEKQMFWILKTPTDLEPGEYSWIKFPVKTVKGALADATLYFSATSPKMTLEEAEKMIQLNSIRKVDVEGIKANLGEDYLAYLKSQNLPPTAVITSPVDKAVLQQGSEMVFDGSTSYDDGKIVSYVWASDKEGIIGTTKKLVIPAEEIAFQKKLSTGTHKISLKVVDELGTSNEKVITITVEKANRSPVLQEIPSITVVAGEKVIIRPVASDPDNDQLTITYSGDMTSKTWQTEEGDEGNYVVTVSVSDGIYEVSQDVAIKVLPSTTKNVIPVIEELKELVFNEGDIVNIPLKAVDSEGNRLSYKFSGDIKTNRWRTKKGDYGTYKVNITVSDGQHETTQEITVVINRKPVLKPLKPVIVKEGETIVITPDAEDTEDDELTYTYSGKMNGDTWQTKAGDAGTYTVNVTATDKYGATDSQEITIKVKRNLLANPLFKFGIISLSIIAIFIILVYIALKKDVETL